MEGSTGEAVATITTKYLCKPTGKQRLLSKLVCSMRYLRKLRSTDNRFQPICTYVTRAECVYARHDEGQSKHCGKVHFYPVILPHTNPMLGYCGYLSACHRKGTCRYIHFDVDTSASCEPISWECTSQVPYSMDSKQALLAPLSEPMSQLHLHGLDAWLHTDRWYQNLSTMPAQWIDCDVSEFDLSKLGKFDVILADPPWDIHMSLPYGTLSDDAMRALRIPALQEEGLLFLWVTGRAMELGRQLLKQWGYTRIDELIWIKTNQMERLIRTGRTGHWLNHSKEHCLIALKTKATQKEQRDSWPPGRPSPLLPWMHAGIGTDVIVAQVRDTSQKPDELYSMIERICPGGRKIELFGRRHNIRPGWLTLGNQLKSTHVVEPVLQHALMQQDSDTARP